RVDVAHDVALLPAADGAVLLAASAHAAAPAAVLIALDVLAARPRHHDLQPLGWCKRGAGAARGVTRDRGRDPAVRRERGEVGAACGGGAEAARLARAARRVRERASARRRT